MAKMYLRMVPLLACLLLVSACSGAPSSPSPAVSISAPTSTTILLSGQSNAVQVWPYLESAYTQGRLDGATYGGMQIRSWLPPYLGVDVWTPLRLTLHQPARAFVWWQGESDARDDDRPDPRQYGSKLQTLFANVRAENGNPTLPVIVVQILGFSPLINDKPADILDTEAIRQQTAAVVAADPHARIVYMDDLPRRDSMHLTPAGYEAAAQRIIAAVSSLR